MAVGSACWEVEVEEAECWPLVDEAVEEGGVEEEVAEVCCWVLLAVEDVGETPGCSLVCC